MFGDEIAWFLGEFLIGMFRIYLKGSVIPLCSMGLEKITYMKTIKFESNVGKYSIPMEYMGMN